MMKLNKRYFRSIRTNLSFNLVVTLLTILIGALIIAAISTAELMNDVYNKGIEDCLTEDAQFVTMLPLSDSDISEAEQKYSVQIEEMVYCDDEKDDYVLRLAGINDKVNICQVTKGNAPASDKEIMISERFADAQKLKIGDSIDICGESFRISGYMVRTDYLCMLRELTDSFPDYSSFGLAVANRYTSTENAAEIMGYGKDDRNMVVSRKKLEYDPDTVMSSSLRDDYRDSVKSAVQVYYKMCYIVILVGFMLGVLSMYLISNMMIEENTINISMFKILGYRKKEINSLVLSGNHILLIFGILIGIPPALLVGKSICASSAETTGMLISLYVKPLSYLITVIIILASYVLSLLMVSNKVGRVEMTESLKRNNE